MFAGQAQSDIEHSESDDSEDSEDDENITNERDNTTENSVKKTARIRGIFPCKVCGKSFPYKMSLRRHQSIHIGENGIQLKLYLIF